MPLRLILVCKEGPARQAYLREAASIGIDVDAVATFGDLFKAMITSAYQGIMVDLVTSVKSSREEKGITQEILDVFPLVQLRWDQETNHIHTISSGSRDSSTLAHFAAQECQLFSPRAIRLNVRKTINFNVLLGSEADMNPARTERTVTINISQKGCFVFSCRDWSNVSGVWLTIHELEDTTPIPGEIRWRQLWGKTPAIPGIGIRFTQTTPQQMDQLVSQYSL